jgi:hypothetical protein
MSTEQDFDAICTFLNSTDHIRGMDLGPTQLRELTSIAVLKVFPSKNGVVYAQEDRSDGFYVVLSGFITLSVSPHAHLVLGTQSSWTTDLVVASLDPDWRSNAFWNRARVGYCHRALKCSVGDTERVYHW